MLLLCLLLPLILGLLSGVEASPSRSSRSLDAELVPRLRRSGTPIYNPQPGSSFSYNTSFAFAYEAKSYVESIEVDLESTEGKHNWVGSLSNYCQLPDPRKTF